jgi:aspartyl-tRNA(Asn)/glutamyl-tRNA(Gln) amidotransferase subunit A
MGWGGMGAAALGRAIGEGRADPVEVAEALLEAAGGHPLGGRIFARLTPERARAEARAARQRAREGLRRGPLDGVPLAWKDLFDTAGVPTEAGTALMRGRTPTADAAVLRAATLAGTVCLGKTHMTEIAFSGLGLNPITATPPNRHDPERLAGGSSSGAAAAVAWGLAPAATGSDTGGSVRLPAAWNDLLGFKPAHGALPLEGVVPLCPSFDTVGAIARTAEDAAQLWEAMGGPRTDLGGASLAGLRLGRLLGLVAEPIDEAPAAAFEAALAWLAAAGARIDEVELPGLPRAYDLGMPLYVAEAWAHWRPLVEAAPQAMFSPILARVSGGRAVLASDWIAAWEELRAIRRRARDALAGCDAVLCMTSPILPPLVAAVAADEEAFLAANLRALRNTRMANLMGLASVSVPTGVAACGLMLSALPGREGHLLRIARAAERALA